MSGIQRIGNILVGLAMIAASILLVLMEPSVSLILIAFFLSLYLMILGLGKLVYYLTMARNMVGGTSLLYVGIILLDFGAFAITLSDAPQYFIVLYLIGIHAFAGVIDFLRAKEAHQFQGQWKLTAFQAVANILIAVLCVVFINSPDFIIIIFCAGLVYRAIMRIVSAFRTTAIVYIA